VVTAMSDMLVFNVDAESEAGAPLAKQFKVKGFPALIFLNSDGSKRDSIGGYMPPEPFVKEVERIKRDEGTLSGLKREVAANPSNIEARYKLALKLRDLGEKEAHDEQIAAIKELDPEGKSMPMRAIRLDQILSDLTLDSDPQVLYDFVKDEKDG
jgi:hypothetical protein